MSLPADVPRSEALGLLSRFRVEFYECLYQLADALFELTDAVVLCTDGPVKTLVELSLAVEHRQGHGALYAALDRGWLEPARLRRVLAGLPLPRAAGPGRPPGSRNKQRARHHDVGKTVKRAESIKEHRSHQC